MTDLKPIFPLSSESRLEILLGDITLEKVDAIVNAANSHLAHGGGVAGAIVREGGDIIQNESDAWVKEHGPVPHDQPAYTTGGSLNCRFVIHAVGPVWGEGDEDRKLAESIQGSLNLAERLNLHSVAFPAISTGIFGFPKERAAAVILGVIRTYFEKHPGASLETIRIVLFETASFQTFMNTAYRVFHKKA
jgi:O-acetyl-ADP-ribose deacetylase (regulator of RNase III)